MIQSWSCMLEIVEYGNLKDVIVNPKHPYTKILNTIPKLDEDTEYLEVIED